MPPLPRAVAAAAPPTAGVGGGGGVALAGRAGTGVCGPPATRAPCAVAYSVNACIQRYTLFIPPRHQPASSLRPPGTSQRPSLLRGRQCEPQAQRPAALATASAQWADGAGPPPARRGGAPAGLFPVITRAI